MVKIWQGLALSLFASQAQAACSDIFHFGRPTVQLCVGDECETATMSRSCGNVEGVGDYYEANSVLWMFRLRFHNREDDADDEYAVLHEPLNHDDIPLRIIDGRPQRLLYVGVPLDSDTVQKVTCVPQRSAEACDFINMVLGNLRAP